MKTIRNTVIAAVALMAGFASQAHATLITGSADTTQFASLHGQYIGAGGIVRIQDGQAPAGAVIDGALALDFDFRYEAYHVGLATSAKSNNGVFTLSNGGKQVTFGSHQLDAQGGLTTNAFDGVVAGGAWTLRLDNPNGGDPWAAFGVTTSYTAAAAGGGNGGGGNGGGGNGGGGQVPAPGPLGLIAAMALFGAWRRKRSAD